MEEKIVYFESGGKQNTLATLQLAKEYAVENNIKKIIVASTTGETAKAAYELFSGTPIKLISVGHGRGAYDGDVTSLLENKGYSVIFDDDISAEYDSAIFRRFSRICIGAKVAVQCVQIAANVDLLDDDEEVVSVAGTGRGADTAIAILAAKSDRFGDREIQKILCRPR